jgi:transmembrane sensor
MGKNLPDEYFKKLQNNQLTDADKKAFAEWMLYADPAGVEAIIEKISSYYKDQQDEHFIPLPLGQAIEQRIDESKKHKVLTLIRRGLTVAAAIAGIAFTYYTFKSKPVTNTVAISRHAKIIPGGNKAILTLGNGKSIVLDAEKNGLLASQGNLKIVKESNGRIVYAGASQNGAGNEVLTFNTISTPRGGQYQVDLPDGTKVWLNAVSSLRYPVSFGSGDRRVELTGEAYFEVAKDKAHPFKVSVNNMEVKVLGTHFNIMAYADEASTKTTLLEGSVQVFKGAKQCTIAPGEQAVVGEDIQVKKVKTSEAVEWKNGNFNFAHEQLPVIMRKISRWYDIDIAYEGKPTTLKFVGTLPRSKNISEVLKYLELTGLVNFKISERRVIVMP